MIQARDQTQHGPERRRPAANWDLMFGPVHREEGNAKAGERLVAGTEPGVSTRQGLDGQGTLQVNPFYTTVLTWNRRYSYSFWIVKWPFLGYLKDRNQTGSTESTEIRGRAQDCGYH